MKTKKLSEISDIQYGYAFDSHYFTNDNKYPQLVRIRDIKRGFSETYYLGKYDEDYVVHYGDLLIGMYGNFNISRWKSEDALLNQRVCKIAAKQDIIDEEYLQYALSRRLKHIEEKTAFVTVKHLSAKTLSNLKLEVPSQVEQIKIAQIISKISKAINTKKDELRKLDELIKARFVEMFGDLKFDTSLSFYVNSLVAGKSLAGKQESPNKVLNTGAVSYDYFRNDSKNLPIDYVPLEKNQIQTSDLLISRMNTQELVGAVAYVWKAPKHTYLPDRLWKAKLKDNVNPIFIWQALIYPLSKIQIRRMATGTSGSMKNISKNNFLAVKIPYAKIQKQNEFANFVQQVDKSKFENIVYLNKMLLMKILSQLGDVSRD